MKLSALSVGDGSTDDALVRDRDWTHAQYRDWLGDSLTRLLLNDSVTR